MSDYSPEDQRHWPDDRDRDDAMREVEFYEDETSRVQELSDEVPLAPRVRVTERWAA